MAGTVFRLQLVTAAIGAGQVVNVVIEDAVGGERAVYGFNTAGVIATLLLALPQAVWSNVTTFRTPRPRNVTQFEGAAAIRTTGGAMAGLGDWKLELRTASGVLVIPLSPGAVTMSAVPAQGGLQLFPSRPVAAPARQP
jgi:hypothetical protein